MGCNQQPRGNHTGAVCDAVAGWGLGQRWMWCCDFSTALGTISHSIHVGADERAVRWAES